ncbi:MAG: hypothetical protein AAGA29_06560 [Planctomycetota bacterium]
MNLNLAGRQSGTLATTSYWDGGEPVFSQVGNITDALLMAGRSGGTSGRISLNRNFTESPGLGNAFVISFDVNPTFGMATENQFTTSWISLNFGGSASTRNSFPQLNDGVSLMFRGNGDAQGWDDGTLVGDGSDPFADGADDVYHSIRIEIIDAVDGNPFDGSGDDVEIRAFSDGSNTPFFTHTRSNGFLSNYISIIGEGEGGPGNDVIVHALDELVISYEIPTVIPVPGDLDGDGYVGITDLDLILADWGTQGSPGSPADADNSGTVDQADLNLVTDNWGAGTPPEAQVPEPGICILFGLGATLLHRRRR